MTRLLLLFASLAVLGAVHAFHAHSMLSLQARHLGKLGARHVSSINAPPQRQRGGPGRFSTGLNMQWASMEELYQEKWESFRHYNMGRWKGKALHISPDNAQYIKPFSTEHVTDVMLLENGAMSAKMRTMCGNSSAPAMSETVITINEDFECSPDGSYSRDISFFEVPDVEGTSRFCIEMSLEINQNERVRCQALYDFESRLSRIIVYEEFRVVSTGAQRLIGIKLDDAPERSADRSPVTLLSLVGEYRGAAVGRRASRLGGGSVEVTSRCGMQWDGTTFRKELEVVDERLRNSRKTFFGDVDLAHSDVVSLEGGYKLVPLPSGCWACLPDTLERYSVSKASLSEERPASPPPKAATAPPGEEAKVDAAMLERMMKGTLIEDDAIVNLQRSFVAEFGCFVSEKKRKRCVRMYNTDGSLLTTMTVDEDLSSGEVKKGNKNMYDEFD